MSVEKKKKTPRDDYHIRVSGGAYEVETSMHPQVGLLAPLGLLLLPHIRLMLVINELNNGRPRVTVVDVVSKSRGVNDGELDFELLLLKLGLDDFDLGELVELLMVTPVVVFGGRKFGGEEGVDEGGFSETRLACSHEK